MAGADQFWRVADRTARWLSRERNAWIVLGAGFAIYAALVMWIGRGTTIYVDEATFFLQDRGISPHALLTPLNGHLEFTVRLFWAIDFKLFGPDFVLARVAEAVGGSVAASLLFVMVKERVGAAAALAPALLLLFLGTAWEVTFVLTGVTLVWSLSAGLGALLALEREDRLGDIAAAALLLLSVATWTLGLAFIVGAAVLVLLQPGPRSRLWLCAVPAAAWVAWFIWVHTASVADSGASSVHLVNILRAPSFVSQVAASVAGAVAGLDIDFAPRDFLFPLRSQSPFGPVLAVLAAGALIYRLRRPAPPMLWGALATLLAFFVALSLGSGPGREPTTVRYVYGPAAISFLIAADAVTGRRPVTKWLVVLYAVTAIAILGNAGRLRDGVNFYRQLSTDLRARLAAVEVAGAHAPPGFVAATLPLVEAGPYLDAVDRIGSPAYTQTQLAERPEADREVADQILAAALGLHLSATPPGPLRSCMPLARSPGIRPPGVVLRSGSAVKVSAARFGDVATAPIGELRAGRPAALRIPADASGRPWRIAAAGKGDVIVCALPNAG